MRQKQYRLVLAAASIMTLLLVTGCAKHTGVQRTEDTTTRMEAVETATRQTIDQINAAQTSLSQLLQPGQEDVNKSYENYTNTVNALERSGNDLLGHLKAMNEQGSAYFEEWAKQGEEFQNPRIQALSVERQAELREVYNRVTRSSAGIDPLLQAFMRNNREIQAFLSNDLTPKGLEAIAPEARLVSQNGSSLISSLSTMTASINSAKAAMAQGSREGSAAGGGLAE